ncbi:MAG: tellurite resistance TerB family protein [Hyphomicrobiaceae bacterium]
MTQVKRSREDKHADAGIAAEMATTGRDDLMEATIAACALVAHADGSVDQRERRRVLQLMRALPLFEGFSTADVISEFARQERAFEYDPSDARNIALASVAVLGAMPSIARLILSSCQHVLEADGIHHPAEYKALHELGDALGVNSPTKHSVCDG